MIKIQEIRINPDNLIRYYPEENLIRFQMIDCTIEEATFETTVERDEMLKMLDQYLITFDNGIIKTPYEKRMPSFIIDPPDEEQGPGGISMQ